MSPLNLSVSRLLVARQLAVSPWLTQQEDWPVCYRSVSVRAGVWRVEVYVCEETPVRASVLQYKDADLQAQPVNSQCR